jgi:glycosyltransferase involved in cell wall biosynthesis
MKVLHVVHVPFAIPYFLGDQLIYFKYKYNHEIHVASTSDDFFITYSRKWSFTPFELNISRKISPISDLVSIIRLVLYIKKNNFSIVISHSPKGALIGTLAAYLCGVKKNVYVRHGLFYETSKGLKLFLYLNAERLISFFSSKVICVSNSLFNKSILDNISNSNKMLVLNKGTFNGIDTINKFNKSLYNYETISFLKNKYLISNTEIIVGYVGRLSIDKGIVELYEAWKILKLKCNFIKLLLVGPLDERDSLGTSFYQELILDKDVILTGLIQDTAPFYALMNIFILPSYREGFPTAVLEASAMELPVITTRNTGCIDSIIDNNTGIYVDLEPSDIADKILLYILNSSLRKLHGCNGRKFVQENYEQTILWKYLNDNVYC